MRSVGRQLALDHDVGDGEASAGLEHAEGLAQHARFVATQVDDAVGDDDVDAVVRQRDLLDVTLEEARVLDAALLAILLGQSQHLVGHVQAVGEAGRADAPGRQQHVDAAAGAQVEHRLAGLELGQRGRVAAAERGEHGRGGEVGDLVDGVQVTGDDALGVASGVAATRGVGREQQLLVSSTGRADSAQACSWVTLVAAAA